MPPVLSKRRAAYLERPKSLSLDPTAATSNNKDNTLGSQRCSYFLRPDFQVITPFSQRFIVESAVTSGNRGAFVKCKMIGTVNKVEEMDLCLGSQKMMAIPNAGGSSAWSEALSFELLHSLFNAQLLRTEMELEYIFQGCKITDYSVSLYGKTAGVSVTRALKFKGTFTKEDAQHLLTKKLEGINVSSRCVLPEHGWEMQILHIWAKDENIAQQLQEAYQQLDKELTSNTLVLVTLSQNMDYIYFETH